MGGKLIVFEGVEGCGKTTQLQRSQEWLQSLPSYTSKLSVIVTREPGGTELGLCLRRLLLETGVRDLGLGVRDEEQISSLSGIERAQSSSSPNPQPLNPNPSSLAELMLYAADRAQHVESVLKPTLALGAIILCDRYTDSTVAYQGYGRGLNLSLIDQLNSIATGGLKSDLTLWLDVDVEVGLARTRGRGDADRIEQETIAFHRRVQQGYTELSQAHPERIVRVDASFSEAAVQEQIQGILSQWLAQWYEGVRG